MSEQKMKITDGQFSDFTGTMFNTPFTKSISDVPMTVYRQNQLTACFQSTPLQDPQPESQVQSTIVEPNDSVADETSSTNEEPATAVF